MENPPPPKNGPRKRSAVLRLGLTAAVAWSMRCGGGPRRIAERCVDDSGRVVEDRYCDQSPVTAPHPYHWYYGGSGFYPGESVSGGSDRPAADMTAIRTSSPGFSPSVVGGVSSGVTRGGFGATAAGGGEAGE